MAVCVSLINMKGGVGKTTLATQIAWYAAESLQKKVLLIDLDPQANASQSIMGAMAYVRHLEASGHTVVDIFEEFTFAAMIGDTPKRIEPFDAIYYRLPIRFSDDGNRELPGGVLGLVPSRLELSGTLRYPYGKESLLARFVGNVEKEFDLILIDCSPTESILTDAAYLCSRFVLVPIRAEFLATIGFPLLDRSIKAFKMRHEESVIEVCGLVFNDFDRPIKKREHKQARRDVKEKANQYSWYVFKNDIPHSDSYFRAARDGLPIGSTRGARFKVIEEFCSFAAEFFDRIGIEL